MMSRWGLAGVLISAALVLAACGDEPSEGSPPASVAPVGEAPATAPPTAAPDPAPPVTPVAETTPAIPPPDPASIADAAPPVVEPAMDRTAQIAPGVAAPADDLLARIRAVDPATGEALAVQCGICHTFAADGPTRLGPNLYDIVAAPIARDSTFTYSAAMIGLAATGGTWTFDLLDAFLANPAAAVPGTRMGFGGIEDAAERVAILAYLRSLSEDPEPLGGPREEGRTAAIAAGLAPIVFTEEQVAAGRDFSTRFCARCHGTNYRGTTDMREYGEAPGIVGPLFEARWFGRPVGDLLTLLATDTREDYHGGLTPERYANVIAYLAERNGLVAGDVPLPVDEAALAGIGFYQ
ncbi:MAG: hypothetical protein KIS68_02160 [Bauldia sp.]|nr:hypothetical protein [Bauldia sp.]